MARGRQRAPWVKWWIEVLDDPKFAGWRLADVGLWADLLALAGKSPVRGKLLKTLTVPLSDSDIIELLGLKGSDLRIWHRQLPRMMALGMVHRDEAGVLCITNWHIRQDVFLSDLAPHSLRFSSGLAPNSLPLEEEGRGERGEIDTTTTTTTARAARAKTPTEAERAAVFTAYESNFGLLTPFIAGSIEDLLTLAPADWVMDAMRMAVEANARRLSYVQKIINRWLVEGKDDGNAPRRPDINTSRAKAVPGNQPAGAFADLE